MSAVPGDSLPAVVNGMDVELESHTEGYSSLYDEIGRVLGPTASSSAYLEDLQDEIQKNHANEKLLQSVVRMLPQSIGGSGYKPITRGLGRNYKGRFMVDRSDTLQSQYRVRILQGSVLWHDDNTDLPRPFFVFGRQKDPRRPEDTQMLLLPAITPKRSRPIGAKQKPLIVSFRHDDVVAYDEHIDRILNTDFTNLELDEMVSRRTGKVIVGLDTPGSIMTSRAQGRRRSSEATAERVSLRGVRLSPTEPRQKMLREGVPDWIIDTFDVRATVAKLAIAHGVVEQLREEIDEISGRIIDFNLLPKPPDVTTGETSLTREHQLEEQNNVLRTALARVLSASGVLSDEQAEEHISATYPRL